MIFANPSYLYLLILLIPLIAWYIYKLRFMQASFNTSSTMAFEKVRPTLKVYLRHLPFLLRLISIALVIIVLARPQNVSSFDNTNSEGINIVMAIDVSGTMLINDFAPNRLEAAKKVAAEFVNDRPNDNIGLVIFAGESFTQCPLTTDHRVLLNLLNEVSFGMIEDGTAIGLGLANAVNRLKDTGSKSNVVILLTDGSNNAGQIAPLTAAEIAQSYGIRVYTIGVGSRGTVMASVMTPFGVRQQAVQADIDEDVLKKIATITGGQYNRATDNSSLKEIYDQIDQLEKFKIKSNTVTNYQELYFPYALAALLIILLELILRRTLLRSIP